MNAIAPGLFPTRMTQGLMQLMGERAATRAPLNRVGGPEDLKGLAVLFASDACAFISRGFGRQVPFASYLGIEMVEAAGGRAVLTLALRPELTSSFEIAHGGAPMTLLDIAMALAARSLEPMRARSPWR